MLRRVQPTGNEVTSNQFRNYLTNETGNQTKLFRDIAPATRRQFLKRCIIAGLAVPAIGSLIAACGGDEEDASNDGTEQSDSDNAPDQSAGNPPALEKPDIDLAMMPAPGEAKVEVDGNSFVYLQSESLENQHFSCDVSSDAIVVNFQTPEGHSLMIQVGLQDSGVWFGSIVASTRDSDRTYQSTSQDGMFAIEGTSLLYSGPFTYRTRQNPGDFIDAGQGSIAVTCP
jgi:hypothetical protein